MGLDSNKCMAFFNEDHCLSANQLLKPEPHKEQSWHQVSMSQHYIACDDTKMPANKACTSQRPCQKCIRNLFLVFWPLEQIKER